MTAQQAVLSLGTITLVGCGGGLVLIHGNNPLLKGLNWMGCALGLGGVAAGAILATTYLPALEPLANLLVLLAFFCCYRADRYLLGLGGQPGRLATILLAVQGSSMALQWLHLLSSNAATFVLSALVVLQITNTARLIFVHAIGRARRPAQATVSIMALLIVANMLRAACVLPGVLDSSRRAQFDLATYFTFLSLAIALAFAFFWRTTTKLSGELEHMASTDPLTRVFNRRIFLQWCESEQARSKRLHAPFSILMLDFDHFKVINDTYGHHVGDEVLCAAVERIQDSVRGIDVLCRWGGEEFTVLLPNASEEATSIVAERVRRNINLVNAADPRFSDTTYAGLQLSASIGTATFASENDSFEHMLKRADEALYKAKRSGRNCVVRSAPNAEPLDFIPSQLNLGAH